MRISADEAMKRTLGNRAAKWPSRSGNSRLHPTCVPSIDSNFTLEPGEPIFTIGSCFARNVEVALKKNGFPVPAFEFDVPLSELWHGSIGKAGILNKYTPHSMLNEVAFAFSDSGGEEFMIEDSGGLFIDAQLHTTVAVPMARALERRAQIRDLYRKSITECRVIVVTLGLIEAWWDTKSATYLNETPVGKMIATNPGRFEFEVLSFSDANDTVLELLRLMKRHGRQDQRVILTVSPVPIQRTFTAQDALVANTYSKSVLRVSAQQAIEECKWVDYFPSFESVALSSPELSWEDDLIHVKSPMIAQIVDRMLNAYSQQPISVI